MKNSIKSNSTAVTIELNEKIAIEPILKSVVGVLFKDALNTGIFDKANGLMNMWLPEEGTNEFYNWTKEVEEAVGRKFMGNFIDRKVAEEDMKPIVKPEDDMLKKLNGDEIKLKKLMAAEYGEWLTDVVQKAEEIFSKEENIDEWGLYILNSDKKAFELGITYGEILAFNLGMNIWVGWLENRIEDSFTSDTWEPFKRIAEDYYEEEFIHFLEDIRADIDGEI